MSCFFNDCSKPQSSNVMKLDFVLNLLSENKNNVLQIICVHSILFVYYRRKFLLNVFLLRIIFCSHMLNFTFTNNIQFDFKKTGFFYNTSA